jgi:hypothetical protein
MTQMQPDELVRDADGYPLPPWRTYKWWPTSIGWRMGGGEEYLWQFRRWFDSQTGEVQKLYRSRYRPPLYWWLFYRNFGVGPLGYVLELGLHLISLPVTIPSYWWRRLFRRSPEWGDFESN